MRAFDGLLDVTWLVGYAGLTGAGSAIESVRHWIAGFRSGVADMASSTSVGHASDVAHSEHDPVRRMSVGHRYANLAAVVLPAAAVVAAAILTWGDGVDVADLVALVVAYTLSGLGITVGFHRLLTHRSFIAPRWFELTMAVLGTTTAQGP